MNRHLKAVVVLCLLGIAVMLGYKGFQLWQEDRQQLKSTDAINTKGTITLAKDGWVGYFLLCSQEMTSRLRRQGWLLQCVDDQADYQERFKKLDRGDYTFAVATIDSYLQNAERIGYSAPIIAVIDESKGGDAIVARRERVSSIEELRDSESHTGGDSIKVAFTPDSPSEHLLRAVRSHFDILPRQWLSRWRVETEGSREALAKLESGAVDLAVLWEPEVTRALANDDIVRLLGTEDTQKLIVDILLVNRDILQQQADLVTVFLKAYFQTLHHYRNNQSALLDELGEALDLSAQQVRQLLAGVEWKTLTENNESWFGTGRSTNQQEYLFDTIEAAMQLLLEDEVFTASPIPNDDPYRLISSAAISSLYQSLASTSFAGSAGNQEDPFPALSDSQWQQLRKVGTFKIRPISFSSGTSELTSEGRQQIDQLMQNLQHYPNFRVEIRGHTGTRGDGEANKQLSLARATEVFQYLVNHHQQDKDRLRPLGLGGEQPLQRKANESSRSYNYRLPRVEIVLLSGEI